MKNQKGLVETVLLLWVIAGLTILFVPNPISTAVGVGIRPNKTIQTEKVELIKDKDGTPIAYKTVTSDRDIQQPITVWQQLRALPVLWIFLMFLGVFFTPIAGIMTYLNRGLKVGFKQIVTGVEEAKKLLPKESNDILDSNLSKKMDTPAKSLVKKIKVKL